MLNAIRLLNPELYDRIQPYRVTDDKLMPWAYQRANPNGRPLHDDWGIMSKNSVLQALQPYQRIARMDCAYRVPLPFKQLEGPSKKEWVRWDPSYPTVPGTPIELRPAYNGKDMPHALIDVALAGYSAFGVFLDGEWVRCFERGTYRFGARRLAWYRGLKQDTTVNYHDDGSINSDLMAWFPEVSITFIKTEGD